MAKRHPKRQDLLNVIKHHVDRGTVRCSDAVMFEMDEGEVLLVVTLIDLDLEDDEQQRGDADGR